MRLHRVAAPLALVLLCACGGDGGGGGNADHRGGPAPGPRFNVLLVSLDTTRADRLGCYGRSPSPSPRIDALAAGGARVEHAVAPAPLTLPSHSSVMTGVDPFVHGARYNGAFRLPEAQQTLAETLGAAGYDTAAAVGAFVLNHEFGIGQGFAVYHDVRPGREERPGAEVATDAIALLHALAADERPFFLFVHLFDPHAPYAAPAPFAGRQATPYLDEIAYADAQVGRLLDELDTLRLAERTLVVLIGDHGESLGDHGEPTHSIFVYDATTSVPLIVRAPGVIDAGTTVSGQARLIDVAPTVLDFVGAPALPAAQGVSLVPRLLGAPAGEPLPAYSETLFPQIAFGYSPLRALRADGYKYVLAPSPELYDLARDPGELHDLADAEPERAERMRERLRAWIADAPAAPVAGAAEQSMTPEQLERLRSLGYLGGSSDAAAGGELERFEPVGADPKERLEVMTLSEQALAAKRAGRLDESERMLRRAIEIAPDETTALRAVHELLAEILAGSGRYEEAIEHYRDTLAGGHVAGETPTNLGAALLKVGRLDEAVEVLETALRGEPVFASTHVNYAVALLKLGRVDEAVAHFRQAIAIDPASTEAALGLGSALAAAGRPDEAVAAYVEAIARLDDPAPARRALAELYVEQKRPAPAIEQYAALLADTPDDARAHQGLGLAYLQQQRFDEAVRSLGRSVELDPRSPHAWYALSAAQAALGRGADAAASAAKAADLAEKAGEHGFAERIRRRIAEQRKAGG